MIIRRTVLAMHPVQQEVQVVRVEPEVQVVRAQVEPMQHRSKCNQPLALVATPILHHSIPFLCPDRIVD
jgi:hypothetical protein